MGGAWSRRGGRRSPRMLPRHPHEFGPGVGRALNPPQAGGPLRFGSGVLFPMTHLGLGRRGLGGSSAPFRPSGAQRRGPAGPRGRGQAGAGSGAWRGWGVGGAPPPRSRRTACGVVTDQPRRFSVAFAASAASAPQARGPAAPGSARPRVPASPRPGARRPRSRKMTLKASEGESGGAMRTALSDLYLEHLLQKRSRPEVSCPRGPARDAGRSSSLGRASRRGPSPPAALPSGVLPPGWRPRRAAGFGRDSGRGGWWPPGAPPGENRERPRPRPRAD